MDVEDEIPDGSATAAGQARQPGRAKKVPRWLAWLQPAGYLVAVVLFLAMAGPTRAAVETRVAYDTAPVCTVGGATQCGADDVTRETITVTGSTTLTDDKNRPTALVLDFSDPSGQLGQSPSAQFTGNEMPSLDSATGAGQQFAAELWHGQLMWVAAVGDPDGDRWYTDQSVERTTKYTLVTPAVIGGIDFVFCCFGWWLLVRRGWASDRGSFRPLYMLACVIVTASGWELLARTEPSGVTVMGVGLVMAALLGLPLPGRQSTAAALGRIRAQRSLRAARKENAARDGIFR
jgi:hypothetical protein